MTAPLTDAQAAQLREKLTSLPMKETMVDTTSVLALLDERDALRAERDALAEAIDLVERGAYDWKRMHDAAVDAATHAREAAEADAARLRKALERIRDGYGPNHLSTFCRHTANSALTTKGTAE